MTTTLEAVDSVYHKLAVGILPGTITGGLYKENRPTNSKSEDVVINSLSINSEQLQEGILNVNIHVPNLIISVNSIQDNSQPDFVRLKTLTALAISDLIDVWTGNIHYTVQQHALFSDNELNEHYSNIRLEFYSTNI
ncbi:hypothetical protein AB6805_30625 [Chitinophaga sp. RCC_12]|uniref:hypothetical protein n=1 Tax=Chitinophaga sp. RCC_12 TaxID=3239226 RepID=UPI003526A62C